MLCCWCTLCTVCAASSFITGAIASPARSAPQRTHPAQATGALHACSDTAYTMHRPQVPCSTLSSLQPFVHVQRPGACIPHLHGSQPLARGPSLPLTTLQVGASYVAAHWAAVTGCWALGSLLQYYTSHVCCACLPPPTRATAAASAAASSSIVRLHSAMTPTLRASQMNLQGSQQPAVHI